MSDMAIFRQLRKSTALLYKYPEVFVRMGGELGELKGAQIREPFGYYRQYIPIVVGGRKLIYVNAFSSLRPSSWQTRVVDVCDSGPREWGVLYNPVTEQFWT